MLEAPSADQLERMMSLEPIAQVLHMYRQFCNRQMQLHNRDKYLYQCSNLISPFLIVQADLALISEVAARVDEAVASFEVQHTEELVVPFGDN